MADEVVMRTEGGRSFSALKRMSAGLARDPLLIQGAGGNTSLKQDDVLWIKASGCWLEDAEEKPIFVPVRLSKVRDNIIARRADACADARLPHPASEALRPSIETALHAVMPHAVVIHAHAVNCATTAILADGQARFERAMGHDLHGIFIPYATPGLPLANAVREAITGNDPPDVILLQNHGVVVGADRAEAAAGLLREVERRLEFAQHVMFERRQANASAQDTANYDVLMDCSEMALDPTLFNILTTFALTPDQVVFLGGPVCGIRCDEDIEITAQRFEQQRHMVPALILRKGVGAFRYKGCSQGTKALIAWLIRVAERIPLGADILSLPMQEVAHLLGWDAEQYRLQLDQDRYAQS